MSAPKILIVEDEDFQYEIYEEALSNYSLLRATTARQALAFMVQEDPRLIILDHVLDKGELGMDFIPEFKQLLPHVPIIVVSGALEVEQQLRALQGPRRAHYCLPKPLDIHELQATVRTALAECGEVETIRQFEGLERSKRQDAQELYSRSTDRLSRQSRVKELIAQSSQRPNISMLARKFRVARRTIIRDLHELIRRGEIPPSSYPDWENPVD
ncbi:MAG TPA: response regulator [Verrucomicrobiae bacterium]|jgi:DNA-binding NtrC family response regulator|nr:response regulator [Verrucomicrobiae bacterium]